jgi:glutamate dehydrogenase
MHVGGFHPHPGLRGGVALGRGRCRCGARQLRGTPSIASGAATRRTTASIASSWPPASTGARWRCCAATASTCCRPACRSRRAYMEETLARYPMLARLLVELFEAKFDPSTGRRARPTSQRAWSVRTALTNAPGSNDAEAETGLSRLIDAAPGRASADAGRRLRCWALLDRVCQPRRRSHPAQLHRVIRATLRTGFRYYQTARRQAARLHQLQVRHRQASRPAEAAPYREIFVYGPARGRRAPALRAGGARRPALVGPARGLPHRSAGPGEGADGEEHGDRAGGLQGRLRRQASAPAAIAMRAGRRRRLLPPSSRPARHHRQPGRWQRWCRRRRGAPRRRRSVPGGRRRQGHGHVLRHRQRHLAAEYGFWLGDAFASGGSVGYDHKGMGITARGGWESVKRHFREMGRDTPEQDFTCVGIGDMSGDVFGNGMLLSKHIRLVAPSTTATSSSTRTRMRPQLRRARAPVQAAALELGRLRRR